MTRDQALNLIGHRPRWELLAMRRALSLHAWLNTGDDARRLQAVKILLRGKQ
jgi:hypothetical protein